MSALAAPFAHIRQKSFNVKTINRGACLLAVPRHPPQRGLTEPHGEDIAGQNF
jgi:hypothetical protein